MRVALQLSAALLPLLCAAADACPFCKDATPLGGGGGASPAAPAGGFNASIYLIFAALAAAVAVVAWALATAARSIVIPASDDASDATRMNA